MIGRSELDAITFDCAGTLLQPARSVAEVYAEHAQARGVVIDAHEVAVRLPTAMARHRALRSRDAGWRAYWSAVVHDTTGSDDAFDDLYAHYRGAAAWRVADGASACLATLREAGLRIGLVSNWDDRLRHTLAELDLLRHFDAVIVSAEGPDEKPAASFFARALAALHVTPARWLHVGDDHHDDIAGARAIGGHALHIAHDIAGFDALRAMLTSAVRT